MIVFDWILDGKGKQSTMVVSESDNDLSDTNGEQTLYDKPLLAAKYNSNLSSTKSRGFRVPVQDSTDSPKIRKPGQTTPINDSSVAWLNSCSESRLSWYEKSIVY